MLVCLLVSELLYGAFDKTPNQAEFVRLEPANLLKSDPQQFFVQFPLSVASYIDSLNVTRLLESEDAFWTLISRQELYSLRDMAIQILPDGLLSIKKDQFTDPAYQFQFSLHNSAQYAGYQGEDINVLPAWEKGLYGQNITIAVVDDGCKTNHIEFRDRFLNEHNLDLSNGGKNVEPASIYETHGTSCLGVVGASNNSYCGVGVAPLSNLVCHRMYTVETTVYTILKSLEASQNAIDVASHSWSLSCDIFSTRTSCWNFNRHPLIKGTLDKTQKGSRNGLGRNLVFAAGNEAEFGGDVNQYIFNSERRAIAVAATTDKGLRAYYSNRGTALLVNAPSGGQPQKFSGIDDVPFVETADGIDTSSCMRVFTGTSASAPLVSGAISLMLQANPRLSWRDVQMILALTATTNDPLSETWHRNSRKILYSPSYGFGRVDTALAIETAKSWKSLSSEIEIESTFNACIPVPTALTAPANIRFNIAKGIDFLESVILSFSSNTDDLSQIMIQVTSPSKTVSKPKIISSYIPKQFKDMEYEFLMRDFLGESTKGVWEVKLWSYVPFSGNNISNVTLSFYGTSDKIKIPTKRRGAYMDAETPRGNDLNVSLSSNEFYCDEVIEMDASISEHIEYPSLRASLVNEGMTKRLPFGGSSSPRERMTFSIPCLFKEYFKTKLLVELIQEKSFALLDITVHPTEKAFALLEPRNNQTFTSGDHMTIKWISSRKHLLNSGWEQKVVLRLYDLDTKKLAYENSFFNNGHIDLFINASSCTNCLLTLTPVDTSESSHCTMYHKVVHLNPSTNTTTLLSTYLSDTCIDSALITYGYKHSNLVLYILLSCLSLLLVVSAVLFVLWRQKKSKNVNKEVLSVPIL